MELNQYFTHLSPNDIRLKGHRIAIEDVLYEYIYNDMTPKELWERFPTLNLEKIHAVLLYYHQNKDALDAYLADWLRHGEQMRQEQTRHPSPIIQRLKRIRAERSKNGHPA